MLLLEAVMLVVLLPCPHSRCISMLKDAVLQMKLLQMGLLQSRHVFCPLEVSPLLQ